MPVTHLGCSATEKSQIEPQFQLVAGGIFLSTCCLLSLAVLHPYILYNL